MHTTTMKSQFALHPLLLSLFLVGCAAISGEGHLLTEDAKASGDAKSCCNSVTDLLADAKPVPTNVVSLTPQGRHFGFASGLAPLEIYRYTSTGQSHQLSLLSHMRLRGWAYGGDGKAHYANTIAVFLDGAGRPLDSPQLSEQQVSTDKGRALQRRFAIPEGTNYIVVATDPRRTGTTDSSRVVGAPDVPLVTGRSVLFMPGGLLPVEYRLATYGPISVQILGAAPARQ